MLDSSLRLLERLGRGEEREARSTVVSSRCSPGKDVDVCAVEMIAIGVRLRKSLRRHLLR